ncbi:unnamed protein product [Paramecium pentaurelia]|uniref:Uncharacterized protein n=1 Tax=Paramecium pentaurelia TaxID=43138 RepID=A0A8S1UXA3_9CILI|nr:unnamed protein product [Paramecium pentaurelia]
MFQDYCDIPNAISEYQLSTTSITLIEDSRVQVINSYNIDPPQGKVFNHQYLNADTALIGLTSLGYSGQIEFQLLITQITKDTVPVGITQVAKKIQIPDLIRSFKRFYRSWISEIQTCLYQQCNKFEIEQMAHIANSRNQIQLWNPIDFEPVKKFLELQQGPYDQSEFTIQNLCMFYQLIKNYALECFTLRISQKLDRSQSNRPRFLFKYSRQIKYIMLLENIPLRSINLFRLLILLLKQIVLQENEQYLNLIIVILVFLLGRIINLIQSMLSLSNQFNKLFSQVHLNTICKSKSQKKYHIHQAFSNIDTLQLSKNRIRHHQYSILRS